MDDNVDKRLENIEDSVKEIRNWMRMTNIKPVKSTLEEVLSKNWERLLYEQLDGKTATRTLVKDIPVSRVTAIKRLKHWKNLGIVNQQKQGMYNKLISLKTIDLEVPKSDY